MLCCTVRFFWNMPSSVPIVFRHSRAVLRSPSVVAIWDSLSISYIILALEMWRVAVYWLMKFCLYSSSVCLIFGFFFRYSLAACSLYVGLAFWNFGLKRCIDCANASMSGCPSASSVAKRLFCGESSVEIFTGVVSCERLSVI